MSTEHFTAGGKKILYVDDEENLALLGEEFLSDLDYQVTCAFGSEQALSLFQNAEDGFDLVVTDLTMPGMSGIQLAQEFYRISPETPVILCSGYLLTMAEEGMAKTNIKAVLIKTDVCAKLQSLLEEFLC